MTFSTVKENQASKKITLVRIKPTVSLPHPTIAPTYWTDNGDGTYQTTLLDYAFKDLYKCGAATYSKLTMTRVLTTTLGNNEWYYDDSSKLLKIKPSGVITSYVFTADFYIFLSSAGNIVTYEDPEDNSTTLRDWLPVMKGLPNTSDSVENILEGVLTISTSNVTIIDDGFVDKYINCDQDFQASFYKKEVKSWIALDDISNISKFFTGLSNNISLSRNSVTIDIKNNFSYLDAKATLAKQGYDPYAYWTLGNWANLNPNDDGKPIRLVMGSTSPMGFKASPAIVGITNPLLPQVGDKTLKAVNTNYTDTLSTSSNRVWGCCRVWDATALYIGTPISAVDNSAGAYTRLTIGSSFYQFFEIGDTIELKKTAATTYYAYIYQKDDANRYLYITKLAAIDNTWQPPNPIQRITCVVIKDRTNDANVYYPMVGRDFTYAETDTGTILYSYITFTNNFEATLSMGTLDPKIHEVYFRITPSGTGRIGSQPGTVLNNILTFAGCTTLSSTFDTLDNDVPTYCSYAIPTYDESDYSNYFKYVQDILSSCFAYLYNNSSQQLCVAQFTTPSSTTELSDSEIMKGSFSETVSYDDIVYQLVCYNPYAKSAAASQTLINYSAQYLHGIDTVTRFVHVLENITSVISKILGYRAYPKKVVTLETKHENLDSLIGTDYDINTKNCVKTGKIVAIDKDQAGTRLLLDTFGD